MQVRVLGCSGSIAKGCRTTSFLIDGKILIDAGTGVGDLSLEEMAKIDHVFLTHSHLDHIAALPLMLDAVSGMRNEPLQVHALPETIHALRAHIFNGVIWPDFARIPTARNPLLQYAALLVGEARIVCGITVEALPASHTVPAVGYAARSNGAWWVYSGDTGSTKAFWRRVNEMQVGALVVEVAFSNQEAELARQSQHLHPNQLARELAHKKAGTSYPIYLTHIKPAAQEQILAEVQSLPCRPTSGQYSQVRALEVGELWNIPDSSDNYG